ncbi:YceI family protein [Lysinimonas soli]|uniref:YceI family protein n=1 Tax=Lysinimonas soli TaxID=1074233 RepID=A0ABW0NKV5_9MICO
MTTNLSTRPDYLVGTWKLDPSHSELAFSVRHLKISKVRGTFETFDVTVVTPENPAEISVTATIDVASVNTKQEQRDGHLRSSDFFLVEQHPTMTFTSTGLVTDGDDFTLTGDLTLRGVTQPVTLRGEFGGIITDDYGNTKAGATASTTINRQDFGVSWNAALEAGGFTLGDDVTISLDLELTLQK